MSRRPLFPFSRVLSRLLGSANERRELESEYIGDTYEALKALSLSPEACRRLARALELEGDAAEVGDFLRQTAQNEANRAQAEQAQRWADQAAKKVRP